MLVLSLRTVDNIRWRVRGGQAASVNSKRSYLESSRKSIPARPRLALVGDWRLGDSHQNDRPFRQSMKRTRAQACESWKSASAAGCEIKADNQ